MLLKPIGFMKAVGGGGATGYTFGFVQTSTENTQSTSFDATLSAMTQDNLLVCVVSDRSGKLATDHSVTDNNSKTWNLRSSVENELGVTGSRNTITFWTRVVEADEDGDTLTVTCSADGANVGVLLSEIETVTGGAYDWTFDGESGAGSGTGDVDNLNSGSVSPSGSDIFVMSASSCRAAIDTSLYTFDEVDEVEAQTYGTNLAIALGFRNSSQPDSSSYSSTVDTAGTAGVPEGTCVTVTMQDGA